jgi:hypothetical protein
MARTADVAAPTTATGDREPTRAFTLEHVAATGQARFTDGRLSLVRFRTGWPWEFYFVLQAGPSRGLEMFVRYLCAEEAARLEQALAYASARQDVERRLAAVTVPQALRGCAVDVVTGKLVD